MLSNHTLLCSALLSSVLLSSATFLLFSKKSAFRPIARGGSEEEREDEREEERERESERVIERERFRERNRPDKQRKVEEETPRVKLSAHKQEDGPTSERERMPSTGRWKPMPRDFTTTMISCSPSLEERDQ